MNTEKVKKYFERLRLCMPQNIVADGELLKKLQFAHVTEIPFENRVYLEKIAPPQDVNILFDRIVNEKRGSICLEMNFLFGWLLSELGYKVEHFFAHNTRDDAYMMVNYPHRLLIVTDCNNQKWICDVAALFAAKYPLKLEYDTVQKVFENTYKIIKTDNGETAIARIHGEEFEIDYIIKGAASEEEVLKIKQKSISDEKIMFAGSPFMCIKTEYGIKTFMFGVFKEFQNGKLITERKCSDEELPEIYKIFKIEK